MNNQTNFNGLERAQLGAALAAGYEAGLLWLLATKHPVTT